jgi:adenine-specific DNA-methyltransferase
MFQDVPITSIVPLENYTPIEFERTIASIRDYGLFHPLILQEAEIDITKGEQTYRIIAGRARLLACQKLGKIIIPATILPFDCPNPHEIALHENLRRNNLPWYEQVELEKELHELRVSEHGEKPKGRPTSEKPGWSQNDTARELGLALGTFSQDMALATELQRNPNLRNVKDKTTALKIIKNIVKRQVAEIEQAIPSEIIMDEVLLGESETLLRTFPNETFDACITDPPWSEYKVEELRSDQGKLLPIFLELFRILKRDSFLFIVTSFVDFPFYTNALPKLGFRVQSYPIIWHKTKTITHGRAPWQYARDYEPIIVAVKGEPSLTTGIELSSILNFDNLHYTKMIHPHEKPIELIEALLRTSTHPGAKVIDPFAGSGVCLEACKKNDRRYIGIEKDKKFYEGILRRLK